MMLFPLWAPAAASPLRLTAPLWHIFCAAMTLAASRPPNITSETLQELRQLREQRELRELGSMWSSNDVYHPGHAPVHVTRLHRYDHSGLGAFIERESVWEAGGVPSEHVKGASQAPVPAFASASSSDGSRRKGSTSIIRTLRPSRENRHDDLRILGANSSLPTNGSRNFLQLSPVQSKTLWNHHQAWLQKAEQAEVASKGGRGDSETSSFVSAGKRYRERNEKLMRPDTVQSAALQNFVRAHTGARSGRAVMRIDNLFTQYVGPIGVGTVFSPEGCKPPANSLLHLLAEDTDQAVDKNGDQVCQVTDQSQIWVVFDTGSTNIWVASDLCESGPCAKRGRQRFNHTRSMTFAYPKTPSKLTVEFGTGKLAGPQGVDDFHIGPFSVFQQTFGMIEAQSGQVFEDVPFEGILGLAFPSMSANKARPFFDTVVKQKALQHNEFAFYFSRDSPAANAIFWGGVDSRFYKGKIEYFPVSDPYYWAVYLHSFSVGDECLLGAHCGLHPQGGFRAGTLGGGRALLEVDHHASGQNFKVMSSDAKVRQRNPSAIVDTGTTYFTAEGYLYDALMTRIPPAACEDITDNSHPQITYTLRSVAGELRDFSFTNDMYMARDDEDPGLCTPAFMRIDIPAKHGPAMVLGEVFLRHYFAVFNRGEDGQEDQGRLGLALSEQSKDAIHAIRDLTRTQPSFQESRVAKLAESMIRRSAGGNSDSNNERV
eukprot:TRINITY_DN32045_c0_g1_i1.p1 TRINITY_DN32045_c0_g1~~TRINITY_DN32045_c0_g1_i1.p1  ORF type:complete len:713 (-),score=88.47 TRINITY_DN32045_c0_g1_i1:38-2176(-)